MSERTWLTRTGLALSIVLALSLLTLACSSAPNPSPAKEGPSPTGASAKASSVSAPATSASPTVAAKPSAAASPSAKAAGGQPSAPAANANWQADLDKLVAAAKKEGRIVLAGFPGEPSRQAMLAFEKTYPDIKIEYSGIAGGDFAPKLLAEREAGQYGWDVHVGGATTMVTVLRPRGIVDPLRPALILPEILDDSTWVGGLDGAFLDKPHQYIFGFEARVVYPVWVNRDVVPESELNNFDQLLDPKWKGKIASADVRLAGSSNAVSGHLLNLKGEDWLRKFYSQDLGIQKDDRLLAEGVVRGGFPVAYGVNFTTLQTFWQEGLGQNVKPLAPDSPESQALGGGTGNVTLVNKAPHPNAARLFVNWLLSKEGQQVYVDTIGTNSRRYDIKGTPETTPKPGVKYDDASNEETAPLRLRAQEIAKELIK